MTCLHTRTHASSQDQAEGCTHTHTFAQEEAARAELERQNKNLMEGEGRRVEAIEALEALQAEKRGMEQAAHFLNSITVRQAALKEVRARAAAPARPPDCALKSLDAFVVRGVQSSCARRAPAQRAARSRLSQRHRTGG